MDIYRIRRSNIQHFSSPVWIIRKPVLSVSLRQGFLKMRNTCHGKGRLSAVNNMNWWLCLSQFPQITVICVYVPGPDFNLAVEHRTVNQAGEPESVSTGEFTHTSVHIGEICLSTPTRMQNILDLCYGNIPNTYMSLEGRPRWLRSTTRKRLRKKITSENLREAYLNINPWWLTARTPSGWLGALHLRPWPSFLDIWYVTALTAALRPL